MTPGPRLYPRRFGQVLLRNPSIAEYEVALLDPESGSRILEIGGGEGFLTSRILEREVKLDCIEPDGKFAEAIRARFSEKVEDGSLKVIKENFLTLEPSHYYGIIGNIPYHISSQIVFRLSSFTFEKCILMVQKDFAERMVAKPRDKEYSRLSVNCAFRYHVKLRRKVSRHNFYPVPKVDSAIVEITPSRQKWDITEEELDSILVRLFSNRRKKVGSVIPECPQELRDKRPEQLSIEEFISVARSLSGH